MNMTKQKIFEVVEVYPQATVTAKIIVKATDAKQAKNHPHESEQLSYEEEVDQGGEARTESVREITDPKEIAKYMKLKRRRP